MKKILILSFLVASAGVISFAQDPGRQIADETCAQDGGRARAKEVTITYERTNSQNSNGGSTSKTTNSSTNSSLGTSTAIGGSVGTSSTSTSGNTSTSSSAASKNSTTYECVYD